ncbi:protein O-mannosyl-transferase family [Pedosphaera parvula]|uniref:Uncharacterized protein n=1 Tax=Pedosphaera parvula (strain Ellin514) TaxID=320771 RepID=B9XC11_PEDPL|nr:DUF2723 domain-containing protein [Pedosphaera parvula]EEF62479.1 hypothetical protein Cflav_PD5114 [Pedosphaera parvula Ellin514]
MNDITLSHGADHAPIHTGEPVPTTPVYAQLFQRADWLSFGLTTMIMLVGYLFTLAPNLTLERSGIYSTGAMYAGVMPPSGYPLWTIYGWLFTQLLPISNIAWRLAVSSATAGALTCGIVALMVSRGGALIMEGILGFKRLPPNEGTQLRVTCGCIAGMAFGFDGAVWEMAVVVDVWPLTLLLLSIVLCLLMRWAYAPDRKSYLYAACFAYGLTLTNSEALLTVALGLQLFILFQDRELGREIFFANCVLLTALLLAQKWEYIFSGEGFTVSVRAYYDWIAIASGILCLALIIWSRKFLTQWKTTLICSIMLFVGLLLYFYLPIASVTNPPSNCGYPRTAEGFFHVLTRGQYERIQATPNLERFAEQVWMYGEVAVSEFGFTYLLIALIPFCLLHRMRTTEKRWLLGLLAVYLCLAFLMLALLNPPTDKSGRDLVKTYFTASHLVLAIWSGCGLILLGSQLGDTKSDCSQNIPSSV